jgi:hypothetical protein
VPKLHTIRFIKLGVLYWILESCNKSDMESSKQMLYEVFVDLRSCRVDQASKLDSSGGVSAGLGFAFGGAERWKKDSELARVALAAAAVAAAVAVAASRARINVCAR